LIERTVYQCEYCMAHKARPKVLFSKYRMRQHEEQCFYNPKNRTCCTCIYNDYMGEYGGIIQANNCIYPGINMYPSSLPKIQCVFWKNKKEDEP